MSLCWFLSWSWGHSVQLSTARALGGGSDRHVFNIKGNKYRLIVRVAWPNFIPEREDWTTPLVLWSNTTLGLLAFWWIGSCQQQGRACLTITQLPRLTVLDPRSLSQEQLAQAEAIFERFKEKEFLPANEAYRDDARHALDRAVLIDLLNLPEAALEPLAILRDQWCAEPSVHGGKKTRIDV